MFDFEEFLRSCAEVAGLPDGAARTAAMAREALVAPGFGAAVQARREQGMPDDGTFVRTATFTALPADVPPGTLSPPHDHRMWAVIAVYEGQEDNVFYARDPEAHDALRECGRASAAAGEVLELGAEAIHTIANTRHGMLRAVHFYGGDLIGTVRSVWDAATGEERTLDWDALRGRTSADAS